MAEPAAWRARFLQRVVVAHEHIRDVNQRLVTLEAYLRSHTYTEGIFEPGPELRFKLDLTMEALTQATQFLNSALVYMEAAEILALHGGNVVNPWEPLPSIHHFGPHDAAVQVAMGRLKTSQPMVLRASSHVEWTRGHMSMSVALLLDPAIPNSTALARHEYDSAYIGLLDAIPATQAALADLTIARQVLTP